MHLPPDQRPLRRRMIAKGRYLRALLARFRITFGLGLFLIAVAPALFVLLFRGPHGERIRYGEALHHVYFLFFGQPSLPYVDVWPVELLNVVIPPLGIAVIADGLVRFAYLFFARRRNDEEWVSVVCETLEKHVVVCGAGRVGFRVAAELLALGHDVAVVDKREDAAFVRTLRDRHVPVLIDDLKSPRTLDRLNIRACAAIVCATDDDLANLNAALDARRINPDVRVVIRLFDDDLVAKVRDTFRAEALSSSALAAPAMALSALDPRIAHSFHVGAHLMVVSPFELTEGSPLTKITVAQLRERFGALVLTTRSADGAEAMHPPGEHVGRACDVLTIQCAYGDYLKLRAFTGESHPPAFLPDRMRTIR